MSADGRHDFDFLFGTWQVHNRKLTSVLQGSTDWIEFETTAGAHPILGGLGNVDSFRNEGTLDAGPWEGCTIRLFDPDTARWSIQWASTKQPGGLEPPVVGGFSDGQGVFFGDDVLNGRDIRVRFYWKDITQTSARWEQAFSQDGGQTWETNWVMTLRRAAARRFALRRRRRRRRSGEG
jgi:hypothetical protein